MEKVRCAWGNGVMQAYHDEEWGVPVHDEQKLYEMLLLECFQAGLSWAILYKKRENFRRAFDNFDARRIAAYGEDKIQSLLQDAGIVRSRRKIEAAIGNARVFLSIEEEWGSFSAYLWHFTNGEVIRNTNDEFPTRTSLSDAVSADLCARGMHYAGSVTIYSYLQAVGVVNDHALACFRYHEV